MNGAHQNFIKTTTYRARIMLEQIGPLDQLDVLWAGTPAYNSPTTGITQADINTDQGYVDAGLTEQNLIDAEYALAVIKGTITGALTALTMLANLPN